MDTVIIRNHLSIKNTLSLMMISTFQNQVILYNFWYEINSGQNETMCLLKFLCNPPVDQGVMSLIHATFNHVLHCRVPEKESERKDCTHTHSISMLCGKVHPHVEIITVLEIVGLV